MKPAPFQYHRPSSVDEAMDLLTDLPDSELMAGNQSLSIVMANRLAKPDHVIDINGLEELDYVTAAEDTVEIGAMVRHRDIEHSETLAETVPMLPEAAAQIAGPTVRNRGTLGGSIGEADPAGNYPCALVALGATLETASERTRRTVPAEEFFLGYMFTALEADELVTGVSIPREPFPTERSGMAFLSEKQAPQTWPTLSAAGAVRVDDPTAETPTVREARIALANAAATPLRLGDVETELAGEPLTEQTLAAAGEIAYDAAEPQEEMHADETYKRELAREYTKRALRAAHADALG